MRLERIPGRITHRETARNRIMRSVLAPLPFFRPANGAASGGDRRDSGPDTQPNIKTTDEDWTDG